MVWIIYGKIHYKMEIDSWEHRKNPTFFWEILQFFQPWMGLSLQRLA